MEHISSFDEFVNESYLKGGRQPIYHGTYTGRISSIMNDDTLKPSTPAHGHEDKNGTTLKSISLTRSLTFREHIGGVRIKLDADKLENAGFNIYPVDEIGISLGKRKSRKNVSKANYLFRPPVHNIPDLQKPKVNVDLEIEYEERIYKDVTNLGKYILSIQFDSMNTILRVKTDLVNYLAKYPHIEVELYSNEVKYKVTTLNKYDIFPDLKELEAMEKEFKTIEK